MAKIVIIGAGATGLSAAYHLEKKGFYDYKLFEKEAVTGGLCGSVEQDGFVFDYTGHLLHVNDAYFHTFINTVVGFENLNTVIRRSYVYSQDVYTRYPYQINLYGLPEETIADCIEGFVSRKKMSKHVTSFPEWVLQNFGTGFAKHFFLPYQRKIFAHDLDKITSSWTGRFVPQTSLRQIIKGALTDEDDAAIGYNSKFFYPKEGGISFWVDRLAEQLKNPVYTSFCVKSIDVTNKIIHFTNGHIEAYEQLITTMPLDILLQSLEEAPSINLKAAADKLLCNKVVNFNIGVSHPNLSDKHWIYYPEKKYPFYRIGFNHNFSKAMTPPGCSSLYGEFAYLHETPQTVSRLLKRSLEEAKRLLSIEKHEIATEKIININHAYVIYDFWREKNLPKIHDALHQHNIYSVGRYGEWKYSSMQEALLDGKKIADTLIIMPALHTYYIPEMMDLDSHEHEVSE